MKSSRSKLAILFFLFSMAGIAQVGIGTTTPAATLDITAANLTGTTVDGLLIPRVSRLRAQTMTGTPTSTVLYVDDASVGTATGTTINVTSTGFYYFDGTVWQKFGSGAANAWNVTGNSGLSGTTNFVGTTDPVDLAFRRNNGSAGKIGATSTSFGVNALNAGAATNNVAVGTNALASSTGADNVAVGNGTLAVITSGLQNTGIGNSALPVNTGSANTAVGFQASNANTSAANNVAVGFQALFKNNVSNNTGIGFQAMVNNVTGSQSTAVGFQAMMNSTASYNTALGYAALQMNSSGTSNTAVGNFTLARNTGGGNTAMGHEAEFGSGSAFNNTTAIGFHALFSNSASNNTALGYNALQGNTSATGNTAVGYTALNNSTGAANTALGDSAGFERAAGTNNTFVGYQAGRFNTASTTNNYNTFIGSNAGLYSYGSNNTVLGASALASNAATANNVAIGYNALTANTGTGSVAIGYNAGSAETSSNRLYIENSGANASGALIYGEFDNDIVRVNGTMQINNPANANGYALPNVRGSGGQVLQTNGLGATSWVSPSSFTITETDPQVSSTATNAVPRWNGTTLVDGVITDDATNVGIGGVPTTGNRLDVTGKTKTTNFQMTTGANNGFILQGDASGNASWAANPATTLSMVNANLTVNQVLIGGGWEKINFNNKTFDTSNEFATGRFTATKAGFYRIEAAYHTDNQSNNNLYSIGVWVNGALYKESSSDHYGIGMVDRSISCLVQLAVGEFVEVYAEDFISGVNLDSYSGKTYFEVQQVR